MNGNSYGVEGEREEEQRVILEAARHFYEKLYQENNRKEERIKEFLGNVERKVGKKEVSKLEREVSRSIISDYLKTFKKRKTPGKDGLPEEFYTKFWDLIAPDLKDRFKEILNKGLVEIGFLCQE